LNPPRAKPREIFTVRIKKAIFSSLAVAVKLFLRVQSGWVFCVEIVKRVYPCLQQKYIYYSNHKEKVVKIRHVRRYDKNGPPVEIDKTRRFCFYNNFV